MDSCPERHGELGPVITVRMCSHSPAKEKVFLPVSDTARCGSSCMSPSAVIALGCSSAGAGVYFPRNSRGVAADDADRLPERQAATGRFFYPLPFQIRQLPVSSCHDPSFHLMLVVAVRNDTGKICPFLEGPSRHSATGAVSPKRCAWHCA